MKKSIILGLAGLAALVNNAVADVKTNKLSSSQSDTNNVVYADSVYTNDTTSATNAVYTNDLGQLDLYFEDGQIKKSSVLELPLAAPLAESEDKWTQILNYDFGAIEEDIVTGQKYKGVRVTSDTALEDDLILNTSTDLTLGFDIGRDVYNKGEMLDTFIRFDSDTYFVQPQKYN